MSATTSVSVNGHAAEAAPIEVNLESLHRGANALRVIREVNIHLPPFLARYVMGYLTHMSCAYISALAHLRETGQVENGADIGVDDLSVARIDAMEEGADAAGPARRPESPTLAGLDDLFGPRLVMFRVFRLIPVILIRDEDDGRALEAPVEGEQPAAPAPAAAAPEPANSDGPPPLETPPPEGEEGGGSDLEPDEA